MRKMDIQDKLLKGKHSLGVEVYTENGETIYNLMLLEQGEKGIHVKQFYGHLKSVDEVKEKVDTKHPVGLVISGQQVLTKKIGVKDPDDVINNLHRAFPGMDLENFYFQLCFSDEEESPVSLARKDDVAREIDHWLTHGFSVVNVFIGNFPISCFQKKIANENLIVDIGKDSVQRMEVNMLVSGALFLRSELMPKLANNMGFIHELKTEYKSKNVFKLSLAMGLAILLITLMINFFFYNKYEKIAALLEQQLLLKQHEIGKINSMKEQIKQKENLLLSVGASSQSKSSFYADRIAGCIPGGIQLESMFIYPATKRRKAGKQEFDFDRKNILLKGITNDSFLLNELIGKLQEMEWVNKVEVKNYTAQLNAEGKFDLTIEVI